MTDHLDQALDAITAGLQHSPETGQGVGSGCVRCASDDLAEGRDICRACRAYLLEDTDVDPAGAIDWQAAIEDDPVGAIGNAAVEAALVQIVDNWVSARPLLDRLADREIYLVTSQGPLTGPNAVERLRAELGPLG